MAVDKLVDSAQLDGDLTSVANAIRSKGGTSAQLSFPSGMVSAIEGIKTKEIISWHQCPQAVRNYLAYIAEHPYLPSDYSTSVIETYCGDDANNSKPIGKTVDGVTHYNEVPNTETPFASENAAGTLTPLDRIRWIKAYNAWSYDVRNCRDLGGWSCDGGTVKYGKLFRNGDVVSQNAAVLVEELGVGAELDLDQDHLEEKSKLGNILYHGATANIQYSLANKEAWKDILDFVFYCVLNNIVLDFHCAVGCDRTGTLAAIIEAILGVSQSDIDTDYEMSSFAGANWLRKRNGTAYSSFINQINSLPVGITFRDKVINWVASLGFTATEINAFRTAMIDGSPEVVTPIISTYTITKNGSNVSFSNPSDTIDQYQAYECNVVPTSGYIISSVQVLMDGIDVTEQVWQGVETNLLRNVQGTLLHCSMDNVISTVIDGQSFAAEVSVESGYTLDGATVSVTLNGIDITNQVWMTKEDI